MALELITGPANAAKARWILDGYRARRNADPILVVPTLADVEHYRRELAQAGAVMGTRVERFAGLVGEIALRAGVTDQPIGPAARRRLLAAAVERTTLHSLESSSRTPGFLTGLERLVAELEAARVTPARLAVALTAWAGADPRRRDHGRDVVGLLRAYHSLLDRLGRPDAELHAASALDALRLAPARWRGTPVYFYGFDDLTTLELDAVETLARVVDAPVTFSLSYEPGREAFAGRAGTHEALSALAQRREALPASPDHYAPSSRAALHHLERSLFEPVRERVEPGDAVRLLEGGGERAELELVAAEIRGLLDAGADPEDVAVVVRSSDPAHALVGPILDSFGIPHSGASETTFGRTALGAGLLALLRSALPGGSASDLLAWLRTPGLLERRELADRLEATVRRRGLVTAMEAREAWEAERFSLDAVDRVANAAGRGAVALLECVRNELESLFAAPRRRRAAILDELETPDARALGVARRALDELIWLVGRDRSLAPTPVALHDSLSELGVLEGVQRTPGSVAVVEPLTLRARRVRALFICGCQEGIFPAAEHGEPFFSDLDRLEIARASGLLLAREADPLRQERHLFYALVSRPEEVLCLSYRTTDDEGSAQVRSLFLDDVADQLAPGWRERRRLRLLGTVGWPEGEEPTPAARERSRALRGPRARERPIEPIADGRVTAALAARPAWSASSLELWASCPVRWFVERFLSARPLEPDPEPMIRGSLSHAVLESTLRRLGEETGSARIEPGKLARARELMLQALAEHAPRFPVSPVPQRRQAALRRLEVDLGRYLDYAARCGTSFEPRTSSWSSASSRVRNMKARRGARQTTVPSATRLWSSAPMVAV